MLSTKRRARSAQTGQSWTASPGWAAPRSAPAASAQSASEGSRDGSVRSKSSEPAPTAISAMKGAALGRPKLDLPLALFPVEEAQRHLGVGGEARRPPGVHDAARIEAVVQVPEMPDVVRRALGQPDVERHALVGEAVRGDDRFSSAVLRVAVHRAAAHRSFGSGERLAGEIEDLVVGVERDVVVHLLHGLDGVVRGLFVVEGSAGELAFALQLGAHPVRRVQPPRDEVDDVGGKFGEGHQPDHRLPFALAFAAGRFAGGAFFAGCFAAGFFAAADFFAGGWDGFCFFGAAASWRCAAFGFCFSGGFLAAGAGTGFSSSSSDSSSSSSGTAAAAAPGTGAATAVPSSSSSRPRSSSSPVTTRAGEGGPSIAGGSGLPLRFIPSGGQSA